MLTTAEDRRAAVQLAKRLLDGHGLADDVKLLCQTILDCATAFTRMAPVYAAALEVVDEHGWLVGEAWRRFAPMVVKAKAHEAKAVEGV
jgi:hypothetical protein